ncbi:HDOD domain-containing protein [Hydrogenovibrio sp. 3SP14C1]|uniref:HDOD domain-containing protein n=1 Tax=Hydrogenovibrio sp. 3SP14C1 TaxID=3038774 RepID=UPI002416E75D|nr:HDOD domain-containing protein [Hydrogenovibrio sp. 3SP14C1]MDG4812227.1 HDOD domain-containing protein [Hydrogenovibrio sp. 3SP14C1]
MKQAVSNHKVTSADVIDALAEVKRLPSFSKMLTEFDRLVDQPEGTHVDEVADLLKSDPRMMAGVIKTANSAKYAPSGKRVTEVAKAVYLLGVNDVRIMIVALSFLDMCQSKVPLNETDFLKHSMVSAFIAQSLAPYFKVNEYEAFLMGLLHDIGVFILATYSEAGIKEVEKNSLGRATHLVSAERNIFGVSHASVGARIIQNWEWPQSIVMGVLGHNSPERIERAFQKNAYLTLLAEAGAFYLGVSNGLVVSETGMLGERSLAVLKRIDLSEADFKGMIEKALEDAAQTGLF